MLKVSSHVGAEGKGLGSTKVLGYLLNQSDSVRVDGGRVLEHVFQPLLLFPRTVDRSRRRDGFRNGKLNNLKLRR